MINLTFLISLPLTGRGPSYTCEQLAARMGSDAMRVQVISPVDKRTDPQTQVPVSPVLPRRASWIPYKYSHGVTVPLAGLKLTEEHRTSPDKTVAFLWGDMPVGMVRRLKNEGIPMIREKFNCERLYSRDIIKSAYESLDAEKLFPHGSFSDDAIAQETYSLKAADYIFSPSPMVRKSLETNGFDGAKLIDTSYGFDPARLDGDSRLLPEVDDGTTFLFVGYLCVRKGAHVLLEAWEKAGIKGRLILLGDIEPFIRKRYAHIFDRPDVEHHAFTNDVGGYYRSADYFVFPSLEEGGPQVTYEASYLKVPSIVSEMGAGAMLTGDGDGIVVRDFAIDSWAQALSGAADNKEHNRVMGDKAHARSLQFTWDNVAADRSRNILERFQK